MTLPIYNVSTVNDTAFFQVVVDEELVATYNYEDDEISLSERVDPLTIELQKFKEILFNIRIWYNLVQRSLTPSFTAREPFEEEMKKTSTNITAIIEIGDKITDVNYTNSSTSMVFAPRGVVTLKFSDFIKWNDFLLNFLEECENFA